MKRLKFYIAMLAAKLVRLLLRAAGRNATHMPGEIALRIDRDFLGGFTKPETLICVTGTNGKTTTSNLLTSVLTANGYDIINNSLGSNIQAGICAVMVANSSFRGVPKKKIAVLEVDERSSLLVYKHLHPDYLICNNIMRDSLKRNAHTDFISFIITKALPETTKVILNGDDIICSHLAPQCKDRTYFGMDADKPAAAGFGPGSRDIVYCPECGEMLTAEYVRFNHIGRVFCKKCGYGTPERDFLITALDRENGTFTVSHDGKEEIYPLVNDNIVNAYNSCGAVALLTKIGLTYEQIKKGLSNSSIVSTRFDTFRAGDKNCTMILTKGQNPVACTRVFSYVATRSEKNKLLLMMIDDKEDNINNVESTCWLYDLDHSFLNDDSITEIVFAGKRCRDQYLKCLMCGVDPEKIKITDDPFNAVKTADIDAHTDILILFDNYLVEEAEAAKHEIIEAEEKK